MKYVNNPLEAIRAVSGGLSQGARNTIAGILCFSFFLLIYGFTSHAEASASDEIAAFRTGVVLATNHNLIIDDIKSVHKITFIGAWGRGDHLYSKYFPGTALSTAILYTLAARPDDVPYRTSNPTYDHIVLADSEIGARVALRLNALLGAIGMAALFLLLSSLFGSAPAAITTLMIGLTTDWWYESQLFYLEIGAGAFLVASVYFAHKDRPYLSGFFLAGSLLFRPTNLVALPVWGLAVWRKRPAALGSVIFILAGLAILGVYNYVRFRSVLDFGYGGEGFTNPVLIGLLGLFLSPGHSFLLYSPVVISAVAGAWLLWKQDRGGAVVCAAAVIGYILMAASWNSWMGGKVWGSRLVVPVIPIMGVFVGAVVARLLAHPSPRWVAVMASLALLGLAIQVLGVLQDPAITIRRYTQARYATVTDSTWSPTKNWLALEVMSLQDWSICNTGSYGLRGLFPQCEQLSTPE